MSDKRKRLVSELQALRGCPYMEALAELRELGPAVSWRAYIDLVGRTASGNKADLLPDGGGES